MRGPFLAVAWSGWFGLPARLVPIVRYDHSELRLLRVPIFRRDSRALSGPRPCQCMRQDGSSYAGPLQRLVRRHNGKGLLLQGYCLTRSAAFSAIMTVAAFVLARGMVGMTDASTTRNPSI